MEVIQRRAWEALDETDVFVLDFARVDAMDGAAAEGVARFAERMHQMGRQVAFVALPSESDVPALLEVLCPAGVPIYTDLNEALEFYEAQLLGRATEATPSAEPPMLRVDELEVAAALDADERARLAGLLTRRRFDAGQPICRRGDDADCVYFLAGGHVSVRLYRADGSFQRLAAFSPGGVFGELAVIDGGRRSADVWTETPVDLYSLRVEDFESLDTTAPSLKIKILRYLLSILTARVRRGNDLIAQLSD